MQIYIVGVVVQGDGARVEPQHHPAVALVEVDRLDSRRPLQHLLLYLQPQTHPLLYLITHATQSILSHSYYTQYFR